MYSFSRKSSVALGQIVVAALFLNACSIFAARPYQGSPQRNFNGEEFHNLPRIRQKNTLDALRWILMRDQGPWPYSKNALFAPAPPRRVNSGIRVTFINHATVLIQTEGKNILTDPIYSERASPLSWIGPKRVRPPGIRFEDLPQIDVVCISHNHYDHMDIPTLRRLAARDNPVIIAGLGNKYYLRSQGISRAVDVNWGDKVKISSVLDVYSVPTQHWSRRGLTDHNATLWSGYVFHSPDANIYFAGDTGYGPHFSKIARRFGKIDIALLPIGAFKPKRFMQAVHMSPADALRAHRDLGAHRSVAIHFGTFPLADDGRFEAPRRLLQLVKSSNLKSPFIVLGFGQSLTVPGHRSDPMPAIPDG